MWLNGELKNAIFTVDNGNCELEANCLNKCWLIVAGTTNMQTGINVENRDVAIMFAPFEDRYAELPKNTPLVLWRLQPGQIHIKWVYPTLLPHLHDTINNALYKRKGLYWLHDKITTSKWLNGYHRAAASSDAWVQAIREWLVPAQSLK
jgi:hypothetical protein